MVKIAVTYNAPEGDSEVVSMGGVRFFDGQAVELDEAEHAVLLEKLQGNQHFDVAESTTFESPAPLEEKAPAANQGWNQ